MTPTTTHPTAPPSRGAGYGLLGIAASALIGLGWVPSGGLVVGTIDFYPGLGVGLLFDRVSLAMTALIGLVGAAVTIYSGRQLLGDPRRGRFMTALTVTVIASLLLVLSANLLQLAVCWLVVSAGLGRLLLHHAQRPAAVVAARHKFLVSRLGDLGLILAMVVLWQAFHTLDLRALVAAAASATSAQHQALGWAGFGLALAALAKSAQFPLHGWLPDTLEAPTGVSALMHAGIVNAGGFLLIRTSPMLVHAPEAMTLLVAMGALTAVLGVLAMWAQTDVKKALAWSTVAQMGFMMFECGLGAFAAALIHLLGHGCYKAHAFLRSGTVAAAVMSVAAADRPLGWAVARWVGAVVAAAIMAGALYALMGLDPRQAPGGVLLGAVFVLAAAQLMVAPVTGAGWRTPLTAAVFLIAAVPGLHAVHGWLGPVLGHATELADRGPVGVAVAVTSAAALTALATFGVLLPWLGRSAAGQAIRIHASHGFYFGIYAERLVRRTLSTRLSTLNSGHLS